MVSEACRKCLFLPFLFWLHEARIYIVYMAANHGVPHIGSPPILDTGCGANLLVIQCIPSLHRCLCVKFSMGCQRVVFATQKDKLKFRKTA